MWGISSVVRAIDLHSIGHELESHILQPNILMLTWCKKNHKREVQSIDDYFCDNRVRNLCHSEHGIHGVYKS